MIMKLTYVRLTGQPAEKWLQATPYWHMKALLHTFPGSL